jgi:glycine betaine/choline ABC-type transport system substrate-binding protein
MARASSLVLIAVLAAGCASKPRVVVGSKNFTEQVLLGEILAQQLERWVEVEVERKLNLGGTLLAHEALKNGGIDLYPEYTGTALTAVLKQPADRSREAVLTKVREGYKQWRLAWLNPLGFDNTFAMVVRSDMAKRDGLRSLSDAARRPAPWRLGVGYEFVQRPDGLDGLVRTYGLRLNGEPATMDLGLLYTALRSGSIEMGAASATDGQLADPSFTVLADDRGYFPPYECAVVVRDEALARHGQLRAALEELSGRISDVEMRRMNAAVDREHRRVEDVAREFLAGLRR